MVLVQNNNSSAVHPRGRKTKVSKVFRGESKSRKRGINGQISNAIRVAEGLLSTGSAGGFDLTLLSPISHTFIQHSFEIYWKLQEIL